MVKKVTMGVVTVSVVLLAIYFFQALLPYLVVAILAIVTFAWFSAKSKKRFDKKIVRNAKSAMEASCEMAEHAIASGREVVSRIKDHRYKPNNPENKKNQIN